MSGKILQVFNFLDIRSNDFLKFYTMIGGSKFIKNMLLLFPKNNLFSGKWTISGAIWCKNYVFL